MIISMAMPSSMTKDVSNSQGFSGNTLISNYESTYSTSRHVHQSMFWILTQLCLPAFSSNQVCLLLKYVLDIV